ncbi:FtsB family cell division protein [Novosphingobium sp. 9]|uniref:FtsB family cell division protein n=1 Tax=Novosphingobium sp. 9 TaxID=2025349 RepID=UPI0021B62984|nr:septum formation initiator [Novosphingobium sp. 9]
MALMSLLVMLGFVIAGPSGLIAWNENAHLLQARQVTLAGLRGQRDHLQNRVNLLEPDHMDPDLAGELVRRDLNVAHPDEMIMMLPHQGS